MKKDNSDDNFPIVLRTSKKEKKQLEMDDVSGFPELTDEDVYANGDLKEVYEHKSEYGKLQETVRIKVDDDGNEEITKVHYSFTPNPGLIAIKNSVREFNNNGNETILKEKYDDCELADQIINDHERKMGF